MARKASQLMFALDLNYEPMPRKHFDTWHAGLLLLLQTIQAKELQPKPTRKFHWVEGGSWAMAR